MIKRVTVHTQRPYEVLIGKELIASAGEYISNVTNAKKAVIVSDDNVFPIYGETLKRSLAEKGIESFEFVFPHGEGGKSLNCYGRLQEFMCAGRLSRKDVLIALGGGVSGDLGGFAASTYQRGIDFIQIPTSLLADVDSSVGGKTAINLDGGKNMCGSFYQPILVLCDTKALETLSPDEYINGSAEVIKYGVIGNEELFKKVSAEPIKDNFEDVIYTCVDMKREFVEQDERDNGVRALLNLGHTIGHAAEKLSGYTLAHGKGVAIGMAYIARACVKKGICDQKSAEMIIETLKKYNLPTHTEYAAEALAECCLGDKKSYGAGVKLVVPKRIGECFTLNVPANEIIDWVKAGE